MYVDHAMYGWGYILTVADLKKLSYKAFLEVLDSGYLTCINNTDDNTATYFFGLVMYVADPGEFREVPIIDRYGHEAFMEMATLFERHFPEHKDRIRHYLLHQHCDC